MGQQRLYLGSSCGMLLLASDLVLYCSSCSLDLVSDSHDEL